MERPLVSIVIPCYKGERFLAVAIESCLTQTYDRLEVIVVDDASPDRCAQIAADYAARDSRVRLVRHPENGGVSEAFNTGFEAARGEYFTRLAQDDLFRPSALGSMLEAFSAHPDAGFVYANFDRCDESGHIRATVNVPDPENVLTYGNRVGLCVMWRRQVWEQVGRFDRSFDAAEDYEYWLRVRLSFRMAKVPGPPLMACREHAQMGSLKYEVRQANNTLAALAKWLEPLARGEPMGWRRRAVAYANYSAAMMYSSSAWQGRALTSMVRSLLHWPFPLPRWAMPARFARLKLLGLILLRRCKLAPLPRVSSVVCLPAERPQTAP